MILTGKAQSFPHEQIQKGGKRHDQKKENPHSPRKNHHSKGKFA
jgi:hypothetical protein